MDNPFRYRDAIMHQGHIKAFADADADGSGDFRGLTGTLDYLQQPGVTAVAIRKIPSLFWQINSSWCIFIHQLKSITQNARMRCRTGPTAPYLIE